MKLAAYFKDFQKFIFSDSKAENNLKDILYDTDLSEEEQTEELIILLESYKGLKIPKIDLEIKKFAKFIRNYYLTDF